MEHFLDEFRPEGDSRLLLPNNLLLLKLNYADYFILESALHLEVISGQKGVDRYDVGKPCRFYVQDNF